MALVAMAAGAAQAAPSVEIRSAIARVTVIPETRNDVAVSIVRANNRLPLRITREGDKVVVDGGLGWRLINCHGSAGHSGAFAMGVGSVSYDEMPQIVVRTPAHASVGAGGAVFGAVGRGEGLNLANSGCGDWTVADQNGPLQLHLSGSGDISAGTAASADVQVSGSANVHLADVRNGLATSVSGSGDITAVRVDGALRVRVSGSGDVRVKDGAVSDMNVQVAGSGDVRFGGVAGTLEANVAGSGDVSAGRVTGAVSKHVAGSGDVSVGR
jgi:hypothetical protein